MCLLFLLKKPKALFDPPNIYNGILLSHKKNEILPFATWMDLGAIIFSEISQTEKDKYYMFSLICGI